MNRRLVDSNPISQLQQLLAWADYACLRRYVVNMSSESGARKNA
jgi:hypothetical protein